MPVRFNSHHRYLDVNRGFKDDFILSAALTEKKEGNRVSHNEREFSRYLDETLDFTAILSSCVFFSMSLC